MRDTPKRKPRFQWLTANRPYFSDDGWYTFYALWTDYLRAKEVERGKSTSDTPENRIMQNYLINRGQVHQVLADDDNPKGTDEMILSRWVSSESLHGLVGTSHDESLLLRMNRKPSRSDEMNDVFDQQSGRLRKPAAQTAGNLVHFRRQSPHDH